MPLAAEEAMSDNGEDEEEGDDKEGDEGEGGGEDEEEEEEEEEEEAAEGAMSDNGEDEEGGGARRGARGNRPWPRRRGAAHGPRGPRRSPGPWPRWRPRRPFCTARRRRTGRGGPSGARRWRRAAASLTPTSRPASTPVSTPAPRPAPTPWTWTWSHGQQMGRRWPGPQPPRAAPLSPPRRGLARRGVARRAASRWRCTPSFARRGRPWRAWRRSRRPARPCSTPGPTLGPPRPKSLARARRPDRQHGALRRGRRRPPHARRGKQACSSAAAQAGHQDRGGAQGSAHGLILREIRTCPSPTQTAQAWGTPRSAPGLGGALYF